MVVFVVAEDAFETVLKPRLVAAEANLDYIRALGWRRKGTETRCGSPTTSPSSSSTSPRWTSAWS